MNETFSFGVLAFTSLLAILNPLSAAPIFVSMTAAYDSARRSATLRRAIVTAFVVMLAFGLLGNAILAFFGITTQAFQIAGGIIFFAIGWDMLQAKRSRVKTTEEEETEAIGMDDVGIIPLGLPTLAGPGTITTIIALAGQTDDALETTAVYIAVALVLAISWAILAAAPAVIRKLGQTGLNVMTRLMGLLIMVIGAQFVINGARTVVLQVYAEMLTI